MVPMFPVFIFGGRTHHFYILRNNVLVFLLLREENSDIEQCFVFCSWIARMKNYGETSKSSFGNPWLWERTQRSIYYIKLCQTEGVFCGGTVMAFSSVQHSCSRQIVNCQLVVSRCMDINMEEFQASIRKPISLHYIMPIVHVMFKLEKKEKIKHGT